ncbi:MAG: serine hydrolase [Microbacteriaceae bacterium]|nr:MAG: serine hydrolase [Microbacteriaceae bacterium]
MVDTPVLLGRRARVQEARAPRHRAERAEPSFSGAFHALGELAYGGAQVSASVIDLDSDARVLSIDDRIVLPTASVGKILLLIEVSARLSEQAVPALEVLDKSPKDTVGDSGLWRHLQVRSLPLADVATLVGATSDNLATNVLLREVGLDAVRARTEELGLLRTALLDLVRDHRGPDDAPQLSVGSTAELAWLFAALARGQVVDALTSSRVLGWLSLNTDLSMVASAFGVDPLSHRGVDHGLQLVNKTGTDAGVRSEAGILRGPRRGVAYAVSVQFADRSIAARLRVLEALRSVGLDLLEYVH